jgi:SAM-dependent methyltransferase
VISSLGSKNGLFFAKVTMSESEISAAVAKLYDTYPFPPEPLLDKAPPGYNWRWNWQTAYSFCTGQRPAQAAVRILDAGCGTGVGTEYLLHLNPEAQVVAIDLSQGALRVAQERCQRSHVSHRVQFHHLSLYNVDQIEGEFDLINCVGVLHHLPDPMRGMQALAKKLAQGGLMHIFVYGELGRFEIRLMQEAIALLQGDRRGDYQDGVTVGREIFAALPENNRLKRREQERWSLENHRDECFADMYVHPQEIDYSIPTLFELIDASGLEFVGFSNPQVWDGQRLIGSSPDLMQRFAGLSDRERYRLIELLDPSAITHYEFFLARPPLPKTDWLQDEDLLNAIPILSPCLDGWDSRCIFNYDYQIVNLSEEEWQFLKACENSSQQTVRQILGQVQLSVDEVRAIAQQQLILLAPTYGELV